jgi:hypothetical protein
VGVDAAGLRRGLLDSTVRLAGGRDRAGSEGDDRRDQEAFLNLQPAPAGQVWRISRIAGPPLFFLLEGSNDLLMDVPGDTHGDGKVIQVFKRSEHANQQWTFLPVFAQLR